MTGLQRDALSSAARILVGEVQSGDVQALHTNTIPSVAADFSGIANSVDSLKPLIQQASITVGNLYELDASAGPAGASGTDFYCGTPVVVLNFADLPQGIYGLVILHATGVAQPQQISLILSETADHRWLLGGFFSKPMMEVGHNGLWYWQTARKYAQSKMNWDAWLYYRIAADHLDPVDFLSSPNLDKLRQEEDRVRPDNLPVTTPLTLDAHGTAFQVTMIDTTAEFAALDLEIHYTPDAGQAAQLRNPLTARKQVTDVMTALLTLHPELQSAFHGVWVQADQGSASLFSLELPMSEILPAAQPPAQAQLTKSDLAHDRTHPEVQARLDVDGDPILSPDADVNLASNIVSPLSTARPGEIEKRQDGIYTMHQDVDEVLLTCAVVDDKGRRVTNLSGGDFRIWEDGVPQNTTSFVHQDEAVSLGIIVDNSASMLDKREAVNAAALNLLKASNPRDATFIVNFSDRAFLDQGFTSDLVALNRGLLHFDSKGTTALYDAVAASANELANHAKLPKQVLLVITDGADNASRIDLEQAIRRVQHLGGPVVYSIGLLFGAEKEEAQRAKTDLERLSKETGGIAYFPHSLEDVDRVASEVARDIRDQYTIGYRSTAPATVDGYRVVHVDANGPGHGKLTVRTRNGYYARVPKSQNKQSVQEAKK
jgi:VWFA-related protein